MIRIPAKERFVTNKGYQKQRNELYVDEAIVEEKPNEAGSNPGIGLQSLFNDSTHNAGGIRT